MSSERRQKISEALAEEYEELKAELTDLEAKHADVLKTVASSRQRLTKLHEAARWLTVKGAVCPVCGVTHKTGPSRKETVPAWINRILLEADAPLKPGEITELMLEGGWVSNSTDPGNVVRTTLRRELSGGRVVRYHGGTYGLKEDQ